MRKQNEGSAAAKGARRATVAAAENGFGGRGRFSAQRKMQAVLRLLRGEDLEALSRELKVTAATLSQWREAFLAGGQTLLKTRPSDEPSQLDLHEQMLWSATCLSCLAGPTAPRLTTAR